MLERLGVKSDARRTNDSIEALMDENAALKRLLMKAADELREKGDDPAREDFSELQRFFMGSLRREMAAVSGADSFEALTSRDKDIAET